MNKNCVYIVSTAVDTALFFDACVQAFCTHKNANNCANNNDICVLCLLNGFVSHVKSGKYGNTGKSIFSTPCAHMVCGTHCLLYNPRVFTDIGLSRFPSACRPFSGQNKNCTQVYSSGPTDPSSGISGSTRVFYHAGLGQGHTRDDSCLDTRASFHHSRSTQSIDRFYTVNASAKSRQKVRKSVFSSGNV